MFRLGAMGGGVGVAGGGLDARKLSPVATPAAAQPRPCPLSLPRLAHWRAGSHSLQPSRCIRAAASSAPGAAGPLQPWQGPANSNGAATPGQSSPYSTPNSTPSPPPPPPHQQAAASAGASAAGAATQPPPPAAAAAPTGKEGEQQEEPPLSGQNFHLKPIHILLFSLIFVGGAAFATITLQFTAGMEFRLAVTTVLRRVAKSAAFRQLVVIGFTVILLRFGLNNLMQTLAKFSLSPVQWDKTKLYYLLREVYQPLELLLFVAALCTISDAFLPSLIAIPKATVSHVVKSILSTSFIIGFASVVFNLKSRFCKENAWQAEMKGDATSQRRWEAYDKLGTFVIFVMSIVLGIQAMGLEVGSVLAIGGIGGLAIGLAGREICENLLSGFLIMSTNPFEVGDEVTFFHNNKVIEGIVADIGWYRTLIRSFEREMFVIPNAVFSKNIVLNVTRKGREWRFLDVISIRVQDVQKANPIAQDIRRIMRSDPRVMNKLHRRVFVDKITKEDVQIYMSFYLDAANRDAFMAIKQDLMVSFVDCVERNGAKLATPRTVLDLDPEMIEALDSLNVHGYAAYAMARDLVAQKQQAQVVQPAAQLPSPPVITAEITDVDRPPNGGPSGNGSANGNGSSNGVNGGSSAAANPSSSSTQNGGVNGSSAGNGVGAGSNGQGQRVVSGEVVSSSSSAAAGNGGGSFGAQQQPQPQQQRSGTPSNGGRVAAAGGEKVGATASGSGTAQGTGAPQSYSSATNHYIPAQHHAGGHAHHAGGAHSAQQQGQQGLGHSSSSNGQHSSGGLERGGNSDRSSGSDKQPHRVGEVYSTHTTAGVLQVPSSGEPVAYAANIATAQNNVVSGPSSTSSSPLRPSSSSRDSGSSGRDSSGGGGGGPGGSGSSGGGGGGGVGVAHARESRAELDLIEAEAAAEQRRVHIVDRGVVAWAGEAPVGKDASAWGGGSSGNSSKQWSVGPSPGQATGVARDVGSLSSGGGGSLQGGGAPASQGSGGSVSSKGGGGSAGVGGGGVYGAPQRGASGTQGVQGGTQGGGSSVQGGGVQSTGGGAAALSFNPAAAGAAPSGGVSQAMAQAPSQAASTQNAQDAARHARQQAAESQTTRDFSSSTPPGPTGLPLRWLRRLATMMFNES